MANRQALIVIDSAGQIWTPGDRVADPDGNVLALLSEITGLIGGAGDTQFSTFGGDGSDGAGPVVTGSLDTLVNGKQYSGNWNFPSGQTLTFTTQPKVRIGVQGRLTIGGTWNLPQIIPGGPSGGIPNGTNPGSPNYWGVGATGGGGGGSAASGSAGPGSRSGYVGNNLAASGGAANPAGSASPGQAGFAAINQWLLKQRLVELYQHLIGPASGGGSGGSGVDRAGGAGGAGCAALITESAELDIQATAIINALGGVGGNGGGGGLSAGGGGGGGGGGIVMMKTQNLIANLGTFNILGGAGGIGGNAGGNLGGNGGQGGAGIALILQV